MRWELESAARNKNISGERSEANSTVGEPGSRTYLSRAELKRDVILGPRKLLKYLIGNLGGLNAAIREVCPFSIPHS